MTLVAKNGVLCFQKAENFAPKLPELPESGGMGTSLANGPHSTSSQLSGNIWQRVDEKFRRVYATLGHFVAMIIFVEGDGALFAIGHAS